MSHPACFLRSYLLHLILACTTGVITAQSGLSDKHEFVFAAGVGTHASLEGVSEASDVYLVHAFTPAFESQVSYRRVTRGNLQLCLGLGTTVAILRGQFISDFENSKRFTTGHLTNIFMDGGLCFGTSASDRVFQIYTGFRVNYPVPNTYQAMEYALTRFATVESTANPSSKLFGSIVVRPEVVLRSKKSELEFILGLQGVLGSHKPSKELVTANFNYAFMNTHVSGRANADFAHLMVLCMIQL